MLAIAIRKTNGRNNHRQRGNQMIVFWRWYDDFPREHWSQLEKKTLIKTINNIGKIAAYKLNPYKSSVVLYISNKTQWEDREREVPFEITMGSIKYIGVNLPRHIGTEDHNFKALFTQINQRTQYPNVLKINSQNMVVDKIFYKCKNVWELGEMWYFTIRAVILSNYCGLLNGMGEPRAGGFEFDLREMN